MLEVIQEFYVFSGLKINMRKSEALPMGATLENQCSDLDVKVVRQIRILGVVLQSVNTPYSIYYDNFQPVISKMRVVLDSWVNRDLSLKGKVTIINTFVISLLGFLITNMYTPPKVMAEVKAIIVNYLWANKRSKVAYRIIIQKVSRGGLNLCDIHA